MSKHLSRCVLVIILIIMIFFMISLILFLFILYNDPIIKFYSQKHIQMNFNIKQTTMRKQTEPNLIKISSSGFCFKYFINLGEDRFGSMTINEKTNLYEEAQKFCKLYNLQPYVAVYLENQMFQEVLRVKENMAVKIAGSNRVSKGTNSAGKIIRNNMCHSYRDDQKLYTENEAVEVQNHLKKSRNHGSILHQQQQIKKSHRIETESASQRKIKKPYSNNNHFEEMFKRHEEIETKKQLSRKASIQKIPFKPTINNLSRKIVDLKRNGINKTNEKQNFTHKVYINKKQSVNQQKQNKQMKKEAKNPQSRAKSFKTIHAAVQLK